MTLFSFDDPTEALWQIQNDGVMGGKSTGFVAFADGALRFTGQVVTEGGGFTSVIARRELDLSDYAGLELRVRGGGRTFEAELSDGTRVGSREVSRRVPFPTTDAWTWVKIPFAQLRQSAHGEPVEVAPLNRADIESVGFYIIDGQDGPFELEVDHVRAYR